MNHYPHSSSPRNRRLAACAARLMSALAVLGVVPALCGCGIPPVVNTATAATAAHVASLNLPETSLAEKVAALRSCSQGGCWLVLRHSSTNDDEADTDPLNLDNLAAQRYLSDIGRMEASAVGKALLAVHVPVGTVLTSKFRRAQETAERAGFGQFTTSTDFTEGGLVVSPNENGRRAEALRALLKTVPPAANGVVVTHKPNIADALGYEWYSVKPSELTLVRPDREAATGYKVLARISLRELHGIWRDMQSVAAK